MEKDFYNDEEKEVMIPPYVLVYYIDDDGQKHIAIVKDEFYLQYLKDRFVVTECKYVKE